MANTVTILTWGLIQWKDAYEAGGNLDRMYDCIKWPLDYFLKAHTAPNELYVQVMEWTFVRTLLKSLCRPVYHHHHYCRGYRQA